MKQGQVGGESRKWAAWSVRILSVVAAAGAALAGCGGGSSQTRGGGAGAPPAGGRNGGKRTLSLKGSDTMVMLTQAWAETYMKKTPGAQISVTGGGSGTGIAALENKATDIAMSSREIKDEEKQKVEARGGKVQEFIVGRDALTVGVHPSNPVDALTFDQLSDLFTGKVTDWSKVGGKGGKIAVLSREKSSGTHVFFLEHVLRKGNAKGPEEYAPGVLMMPASKAIVDELAKNPSGIGYYGLGYHDPRRVKALAISKKAGEKAIAPSMETVLNNSYPISRPLYLYTSGTPEGPAKQFIDFCSSPEGQAVVEQTGFIPLDKGGAAPRTEKK